MVQSKFFRVGLGIALVLIIIYLASLVDFIFQPISLLIRTLFAPIAIAGVFYYLMRPLVNLLSKKVPRGLSILIVFLALIGLGTGSVLLVGPEIQKQTQSFIDNVPSYINQGQDMLLQLQENEYVQRFQESNENSFNDLVEQFTGNLEGYVSAIGSNIAKIVGAIANVVIVLVIVPFVLFYLLKEGDKAPAFLLKFIPSKQREEARRILSDMDNALSSYLQGQILVSVCVGVLCLILYLSIGIEYALVLAIVAMLTNVIPFIGPWIGTAPAVIVAIFDSPFMVVAVIVGVLIIQQIESNLISPQIMGRQLNIHPVTIIFLLLAASRFAGLLGLLLAVPTYAVGKVVVSHTYRLIKLNRRKPVD
ncbi:AI-2E family transporter [Alkalicoccobacillus gibsonii]|jgi:predicted PurR-regulated permease PerM|uniref:AI-2E family transporter n=1 Tax=Alkalicoccobacillus gibsonii TaxID=79881 RepID=A0ABU9VJZ1_9BACI|nr:AI-2E family transporter [Alkalicoccobacillus gibsonii]MBM0067281.1 AI-2E family transporter [Alkalicoccobacillus gibsonii]